MYRLIISPEDGNADNTVRARVDSVFPLLLEVRSSYLLAVFRFSRQFIVFA